MVVYRDGILPDDIPLQSPELQIRGFILAHPEDRPLRQRNRDIGFRGGADRLSGERIEVEDRKRDQILRLIGSNHFFRPARGDSDNLRSPLIRDTIHIGHHFG